MSEMCFIEKVQMKKNKKLQCVLADLVNSLFFEKNFLIYFCTLSS